MSREPIPIRPRPQRPAAIERVGPDATPDQELLALALGDGSGVARLARRLLDRFGSLTAVA